MEPKGSLPHSEPSMKLLQIPVSLEGRCMQLQQQSGTKNVLLAVNTSGDFASLD
jgi:hypothetical protein